MTATADLVVFQNKGCAGCQAPDVQTVPFSMAFQPILDFATNEVFAYEALVRGPEQQGAGWVLSKIDEHNRYWFDQSCRSTAVELAAGLGMKARLSINFLPNAVYEPRACIRATLEAAQRFAFDPKQIMFEFTEGEQVVDPKHINHILRTYRALGFTTAIDDFGAGYAGLGLLADFQPDIVKLDMKLVRDVDQSRSRQVIIGAMQSVATQLGFRLIGEGVETEAELTTLRDLGIELFQGYYFAKPAFESLPEVSGFRHG